LYFVVFIIDFLNIVLCSGNDFWDWWINSENIQFYQMIVRILIGSCLAIGLEVSEYFAVYKTSSITLSVVGIIKVCITYSANSICT